MRVLKIKTDSKSQHKCVYCSSCLAQELMNETDPYGVICFPIGGRFDS